MGRPNAIAALTVVLASSGANPASGQEVEDREEPPPVYVAELRAPGRLVAGFDLGIGVLDAVCSGCYSVGGLSVDGFAGVQVTRRLALIADSWALVHLLATDGEEGGLTSLVLTTVAARLWIVPRFWLQIGGGIAMLGTTGRTGDDLDAEPGAMFSIGGEPGHQRCRGIDLSLRVGGSRFSDSGGDRAVLYDVAAAVGFHWN